MMNGNAVQWEFSPADINSNNNSQVNADKGGIYQDRNKWVVVVKVPHSVPSSADDLRLTESKDIFLGRYDSQEEAARVHKKVNILCESIVIYPFMMYVPRRSWKWRTLVIMLRLVTWE